MSASMHLKIISNTCIIINRILDSRLLKFNLLELLLKIRFRQIAIKQ